MEASHGGMGAERRGQQRLFHRDLPGGGYVAIDVASRIAEPGQRDLRLVVERRTDRQRRQGHRPPVVRQELWAGESDFGDLFRIANDNAALARELMTLRPPRAD